MATTISGDAGITFPDATTQAVSATSLGYQNAAEVTAVVNNLSLGIGQTWQVVTRVAGTTYTNTTGKPIMVSVLSSTSPSNAQSILLTIGGITVSQGFLAISSQQFVSTVCGIVPNGSTYVVTVSATTISTWSELR